MTEETMSNIIKIFLASLPVLVTAIALFLKSSLELRGKYNELQLRTAALELDDTERTRKISADAQSLIQKTYAEQAALIVTLQEDVRHNRDLIGQTQAENARLQADLESAHKANELLAAQQKTNIEKIGSMGKEIELLTAAGVERDKLKEIVRDLTDKVRVLEEKADTRHKEMAFITGRNMELDLSLKRKQYDYENAVRLLRECYEAAGKPTPVLPPYPGDPAQSSAVPESTEGTT